MARLSNSKKRLIERYVNHRCQMLMEGPVKAANADPFPNLSEWWTEPKERIMSFVYWQQRQIPPTKKSDYDKEWKKVVKQLHKKWPAPDDRSFKKKLNELASKSYDPKQLMQEGWWDYVSTGLDVLGMIPGLGVVPDLINAGGNQIASWMTDDPDKKRKYNTARNLSLAASVPGLGLAAGGGKLFSKGLAGGAKFLGAGSDIAKHADKVAKISNMPKTMNLLKTIKYGGYAADPTKAIMKLTKSPKLASALGGTIGLPYLFGKGFLKGDKHATDFGAGEHTMLQQAGMGGKGIFSDLYKSFKDSLAKNSGGSRSNVDNKPDIDNLPYQYGPKY